MAEMTGAEMTVDANRMGIELESAGWRPVMPETKFWWKSPTGKLFAGPLYAWRHMKAERDGQRRSTDGG